MASWQSCVVSRLTFFWASYRYPLLVISLTTSWLTLNINHWISFSSILWRDRRHGEPERKRVPKPILFYSINLLALNDRMLMDVFPDVFRAYSNGQQTETLQLLIKCSLNDWNIYCWDDDDMNEWLPIFYVQCRILNMYRQAVCVCIVQTYMGFWFCRYGLALPWQNESSFDWFIISILTIYVTYSSESPHVCQ